VQHLASIILKQQAMTDPEDDLFSNAARIRPDQKSTRRLIVFEMKDTPIGNFVKWVLLNGFQIDGSN
jgi:hypothetical protein